MYTILNLDVKGSTHSSEDNVKKRGNDFDEHCVIILSISTK